MRKTAIVNHAIDRNRFRRRLALSAVTISLCAIVVVYAVSDGAPESQPTAALTSTGRATSWPPLIAVASSGASLTKEQTGASPPNDDIPSAAAWEGLLATIVAPPPGAVGQMTGLQAVKALHRLAAAHPAVLSQMLSRFLHEDNETGRRLLRELLVGHADRGFIAACITVATTGNIVERAQALDLLADLPSQPEISQLAIAQMNLANDPAVIAAALRALHIAAQPTAQRQSLMQSLGQLTQHANPDVRRQALQAVVEAGDVDQPLAEMVRQGLGDSDRGVRQTAVAAITNAHLDIRELKTALLRLLNDLTEDPHLQLTALQQLSGASLTVDEHNAVAAAQARLKAVFPSTKL
jgi:hypothetical protein